ncbi:AAEL003745-PA [Aedes aegypti]|uniref:AAEL003745-PA n=1 Tax=Aedes aegypti TaxID=7159 RepID=Q0IFY8_AEDAE|nr:AAEL003745-PA [Aedes aegypti]
MASGDTSLGGLKTGRDCGGCDQPNDADSQMVQCDACQVWYHLKCAGETPGVENRPFKCRTCQPPVRKQTRKQPRSQKSTSENRLKVPVVTTIDEHTETTPKKNPEVLPSKDNAGFPSKAISTKTVSSACRSRAVLQKQIEAEQRLAELKLAEAEKRLEEDRLMQERERALREEKIKLQEDLLRKMQELEGTVDDEKRSGYSSSSGISKTRNWLAKQREQDIISEHIGNSSHRSPKMSDHISRQSAAHFAANIAKLQRRSLRQPSSTLLAPEKAIYESWRIFTFALLVRALMMQKESNIRAVPEQSLSSHVKLAAAITTKCTKRWFFASRNLSSPDAGCVTAFRSDRLNGKLQCHALPF